MKNWIKIFIIILCLFIGPTLFSLLIKEEPKPIPNNEGVVSKVKRVVDTSDWNEYINTQLGFSMKIPLKVSTICRCDEKQEEGTPLKVFEDNQNGVIYISQEYYYDANWSQPEQRFIGECNKITYSLELLKKEEENKYYTGRSSRPFLGWKIIINNPKNDDELIGFVKQNFGPTCSIVLNDLQKDGNYQINISGRNLIENGVRVMDENCYTNFAYKILYSPEKQKMMSLILGQECTFQSFPDMSQCYDDKMTESFKFE
ncbi:MAG: hypothetical protein WC938_02205 [Candidatus Paceibacterota bacterium]|jgi:hypothetical protein